MESAEQQLEQAYLQQIAHLEQLKNCLVVERDKLIDIDVEGLLHLSGEKQTILASAEENAEVLNSLREAGRRNSDGALPEERPALKELSRKAVRLKEEIRTMAADNMSVIRDSLSFVEELLGIFTQEEKFGGSYGRTSGNARNFQPCKLSREV